MTKQELVFKAHRAATKLLKKEFGKELKRGQKFMIRIRVANAKKPPKEPPPSSKDEGTGPSSLTESDWQCIVTLSWEATFEGVACRKKLEWAKANNGEFKKLDPLSSRDARRNYPTKRQVERINREFRRHSTSYYLADDLDGGYFIDIGF
jgi:hypothetical protein